jgi:ligand-binding sensor domain-containing protein
MSYNQRRMKRIENHSPALIGPTSESESSSLRRGLADFTDTGGMSRRVFQIIGCLMMLLASFPANALDPSPSPGGYLRRVFTVEDGLPDNQVNVILQSPNGFLWIGTDAGLARFDGAHFAQIHFRVGSSRELRVTSMALAPDGSLWVGTIAGLMHIPKPGLDHFDRSQVSSYHPGPSLSDEITSLLVSRSGVLWVGTNRGLFRFDQGAFVSLIQDESISAVEEGANGNLLIVTGHGFVEWDGSRIKRYPDLPGKLGVGAHEVFQVFDDRDGVRWFCTSAGIARSVHGSIQTLAPYSRSQPWRAAYRIYQDSSGNIWSATFKGIFRVAADGLQPVVADSRVTAIDSDVEGDLWIGTANSGLIRLKDRAIRMYTTSDGLPGEVVMTVLTAHDGSLWAGSNCGGLTRFDGEHFRTYQQKDGLDNICVWSLAEDSKQNLWGGTWGGGLYRFRDGHFTQYLHELPSDAVLSIVAARDGSLWIATTEGLSHMVAGTFHNYTSADGLSSDRVTSVFEDSKGGIWAGTISGVDRLAGEHFVPVQAGSETANVPYGPLRQDSTGNLYALSLANGISRIDSGRLIHLSEAIEASGMVESPGHDLWFSGRNGIFRVAAAELKRRESDHDSPLDVTTFGLADGMISRECSEGQPNIAISTDGKVWVGTLKGLAMVNLRPSLHPSRQPAIFWKTSALEN